MSNWFELSADNQKALEYATATLKNQGLGFISMHEAAQTMFDKGHDWNNPFLLNLSETLMLGVLAKRGEI